MEVCPLPALEAGHLTCRWRPGCVPPEALGGFLPGGSRCPRAWDRFTPVSGSVSTCLSFRSPSASLQGQLPLDLGPQFNPLQLPTCACPFGWGQHTASRVSLKTLGRSGPTGDQSSPRHGPHWEEPCTVLLPEWGRAGTPHFEHDQKTREESDFHRRGNTIPRGRER